MSKTFYLVANAQPSLMKIAPLVRALHWARDCFRYEIIRTAQHCDLEMSDVFFKELGISRPDQYRNCGDDSHTEQTAKIAVAFEHICQRKSPNCVLLVGDVYSTLDCSIVAKKLHIPVAHFEAGLRSGARVTLVAPLNAATGRECCQKGTSQVFRSSNLFINVFLRTGLIHEDMESHERRSQEHTDNWHRLGSVLGAQSKI